MSQWTFGTGPNVLQGNQTSGVFKAIELDEIINGKWR